MNRSPLKTIAVCSLIACAAAACAPLPAAHGARVLYSANFGSDDVWGGVINPSTGVPAFVGGVLVGAGDGPQSATLTPDGSRLYVGNGAAATSITGFSVAAANGGLSGLTGSPYLGGGSTVQRGAITPDGKFYYGAMAADAAIAQSIDPTTGALANVTGSPFTTGATSSPSDIVITPDGKHVFTANNNADNVSGFDIDAANGSLTPISGSPFTAGDGPAGITITPDGKFLYATNTTSNSFSGYSIGASGALTPLAGSPFAISGVSPRGVSVSPDGKYLFATVTAGVVRFGIDASTGVPSSLGATALTSAGNPRDIAITPDEKFLYVSRAGSASVAAFTLDSSNGALAAISGSPFTVGTTPGGIAIVPDQPPVADMSVVQGALNAPTDFDASASTDPDGTIVRYDWDFGDGTTLDDGGPTPSHTYTTFGTHNAKVTLTDDEGCSDDLVWAGTHPYCNGSSVATRTVPVSFPSPPAPPAPPSEPGPSAPSSSTSPATLNLKLGGKAKQKRKSKRIKIDVNCSLQCSVTASSSLLKRADGALAAGDHTLTLRFTKKGLKKARAGKKLRIAVTVKADGQTVSKTLTVKLT